MVALFLLCLYIIPLLAMQVGAPMFWRALTTMFDMWACMLIISNVLQAVVGVSAWRIYREMRVQRLYPANTKDPVTHADVYRAEVFCEPEDVAKCNDGCKTTAKECGCAGTDTGAPITAHPILSNCSDHQKYRLPYPHPMVHVHR